MEPTYTVLGSDGNQYGPVSAEQFRAWLAEGRVTGDTQVWRSDLPAWVAAKTLPEASGAARAAAVPAPAPLTGAVAAEDPELEKRLKSGASWFYWIAALSLINSIAALSGSGFGFYLGLGITQVVDGLVGEAGTAGKVMAFGFDALAAGALVLFGVFANKRHGWAFIVGMILLFLDGLLIAFAALAMGGGSEWISFGFHVFAIFCIFRGFQACRALRN